MIHPNNNAQERYNQVLNIWEEYTNGWSHFDADGTSLKKGSIRTMIALVTNLLKKLHIPAAAPLLIDRKIQVFDINAATLAAKSGQKLFDNRDQGDCELLILDSQGNFVASHNVHKDQLAPFSKDFIFTKKNSDTEKYTVTITYDGTEETSLELVYFMYTGTIKSKMYTSQESKAILAFAEKYGIKSLQNQQVFSAKSPDFFQLIKNLAGATNFEEFAAAWSTLLERGLPENAESFDAIDQILRQCPWSDEIIVFQAHFDYFRSCNERPYLSRTNNTLYSDKNVYTGALHTIGISPFLLKAVSDFLPTFANPTNVIYGIEPTMKVVMSNDGLLYAHTIGIIKNQAGQQVYYIQAHPENPGPISISYPAIKKTLQPGELAFLPIWPGRLEYTFPAEPAQALDHLRLTGTCYPELVSALLEENQAHGKLLEALELHKRIATIFNIFLVEAAEMLSMKLSTSKSAKKSFSDSWKTTSLLGEPLGTDITALQRMQPNVACDKAMKIAQKVQSELTPDSSAKYQFSLPQDCLAHQKLAQEKKCEFVFKDGGNPLVLPLVAIEGKMMHADAALQDRGNQIQFTLAGKAEDFENKALAHYLNNEPLPDVDCTVNQLAALLSFTELYKMPYLSKLVINFYLTANRKGKIVGGEFLRFDYFKFLKTHLTPAAFHNLIAQEGQAQKSEDAIERITFLKPTPSSLLEPDDQKLLESIITSHCSTFAVVRDLLLWTDKHEYNDLHGTICAHECGMQRTFPEHIARVRASFAHNSFNLNQSSCTPSTPEEFIKGLLWVRFFKVGKILTSRQEFAWDQAVTQSQLMFHYNKVAVQADLPAKVKGSWIIVEHYIRDWAVASGPFNNDKFNKWLVEASGEEVAKLKNYLNSDTNFTQFRIEKFVELSETLVDKRTGEKLISDQTFRRKIATYFDKSKANPSKIQPNQQPDAPAG